MDNIQRGILTLVRSGLTGEPARLPEGFSLEQALPVIRRHQLAPLVCEGAVRCGFGLSDPTVRQLLRVCCQHILKSEGQMAAVETLCRAFEARGIDYMILKGCNMKALYPRPELRIMGDADILIRMEQYDAARRVVEELGYTFQVESDHEYVWSRPELYLELHKRLIPSYNQDYHAYFGNGWALAKKREGCRYAMEPEDEFIYLFTHFAKHYRDGGIGCRHVADLWVFRRAHPDLDEEYMLGELKKLGLEVFYGNICRVLEVWFGEAPGDDVTALITQFVFDSGSWGLKESHILSAALKNARETGSVRKSKARSLFRSVFPGLAVMKNLYPALRRFPWLLPVFWIWRWLDLALRRRGKVRERLTALKAETPEAVDSYRQGLNLVGLDFNFGRK